MKALVYTGPNTLAYRDEPDPVPGNDEVLVRIKAVGICGSDMHGYHGYDERRPPPLILGHEASGVATTGRLAGRRVTVNPLVTCQSCDMCLDGRSHLCASRQIISMMPRPGAFAELLRIPEQNLVEVPDGLDDTRAALAEPIAVSYHAVRVGLRHLPRPVSQARTVVLGGGAIGLTTALVLAMEGAGEVRVAETNAARRATITRQDGIAAYAPGEPGEPAAGTADVVFDAVGADATRAAACQLIRPGGTIVHIGLLPGTGGLDVRRLTLQEITFIGSYCYTMVDFREAVRAIASGRLGALDWYEERPLREGGRAFADLDAGKVSAAKIVLRP
jgi:L-iditol 2-dehydrogenase